MKNREAIQHVYDEIHAPDALFGKVMEMNKKESKMRNVVKYAMGTAAAFAIAMITSNGICYAATGETWISKAIVYINGEATEQEMTWYQEGDLVYGEIEVDVEDGEEAQVDVISFVTDDEELPDELVIYSGDGDVALEDENALYTEDTFTAEVKEEDGKVYLITDSEKIDITEDFSDGEATGTFEYCGLTMKYTVTGTAEECEISLLCE